jgi:acyl-CoA synthetase (AMP-forming)/AMP-acid ligase II
MQLHVDHIPMLKDLFPGSRIDSMDGLTEYERCTDLPPEDIERKPESVGIAIPNTELWIVDDAGYLHFVGRMDDVIKSRGEKVAPKAVENVLVGIPGVKESAVIGVRGEILGQEVKAVVVRELGAALTEKEIQRECQARLENFMVPKYVEFVAELPGTDTGKLEKTGLS